MTHAKRLRELVAINRAIAGSLEYDEVLRLVVEETAEFTGCPVCVLLLAGDDNLARVAAACGIDAETREKFAAPLNEAIGERLRVRLGAGQRDAFIGVPVMGHGRVRGILAAYRRDASPINREEEFLLSALADQAAIALEHAQHFDSIRRELEERTRQRQQAELERLLEMERTQALLEDASRRKDEFLAMLAHELRNPLAPIRNAVQVMRLMGNATAQASEARDIIDRQVEHMAKLVDDLLDVSRITRGKFLLRSEGLDLAWLLRTTVEDHLVTLHKSGLATDVEICRDPVWVAGDRTRLSQVIGNLLQNAVKFTNAGGRVSIQLTVDEASQQAVIRIADTGIGIGPEMIAHVFEPFSQADRSVDRSRGGLGLGLSLVKGLVELHGGTVEVCSGGLGTGAAFTVRLPFSEDAPQTATTPATPVRTPSPRRILIIEDNIDSANSMAVLLGLGGHRVMVAHTGEQGIEVAHEMAPHVVFCDIGLPGSKDGYAVARALRADPRLRETWLVALTGYGQEEDQRRSIRAGFDLHLTKPVSPQRLGEILGRAPMTASPFKMGG